MTQRRPSSLAARKCRGLLAATLLVTLAATLCTPSADAQLLQRPIAIQNARILTMDGDVIHRGTLVIKGERIVALGSKVRTPLLSKRVDARGGTVTPGLIDAYRILGSSSSGAATAVRRAEDAFDHYDTANHLELCRNGVTAVYVAPKPTAGVCGQGAVIRLVRARADSQRLGRVLTSQAALSIDLSSTSPPIARLKTLAAVRKQFRDALEYRQSMEDYEEDVAEYKKELKEWLAKQAQGKDKEEDKERAKGKGEQEDKAKEPPAKKPAKEPAKDRAAAQGAAAEEKPDEAGSGETKEQPQKGDPKKEADGKPKKPTRPGRKPHLDIVLKAIDRDLPVRIVAHRSEDILNALELAEEFSFDLLLEGATEAHLVAEALADAKVTVVAGNWARSQVREDNIYRRAAIDTTADLSTAGVRWIVGSGTDAPASTRFIAMAAQLAAARSGRDENPLVTVTAQAADALRVADQIGRLRPGLLADLVIWSDDPLEPAAEVRQVYIGGAVVYQAKDQPKKGTTE